MLPEEVVEEDVVVDVGEEEAVVEEDLEEAEVEEEEEDSEEVEVEEEEEDSEEEEAVEEAFGEEDIKNGARSISSLSYHVICRSKEPCKIFVKDLENLFIKNLKLQTTIIFTLHDC